MCCAAMKTVALVLVLWAVVVVSDPTHPDCVICLRGKCLAPASIYDNRKTLEFVGIGIDQKDNIWYYMDIDTKVVKAIYLDTNTVVEITEIGLDWIGLYSSFGFDDFTGDVYYYKDQKIVNNQYTFTKYQFKTNETTIITVPNPENKQPPERWWVYNGTLYFCNWSFLEEEGLNVFDGKTLRTVPALENVTVNSIRFAGFGTMYISGFNGARKVYKLANENGIEKLTQLGENIDMAPFALLSIFTTINGDLYVLDISNDLIYQLDQTTNQLNNTGAFDGGSSGPFAFDKNNNIIVRGIMSNSFTYYKPTNDQCVFESVDRKIKITKV